MDRDTNSERAFAQSGKRNPAEGRMGVLPRLPEEKTRRIKINLLGVILILLLTAYLVVGALAFVPVRVMEAHALRVLEPPTRTSEKLHLELEFTKYKQIQGIYTVSISNRIIITYPPVKTNVTATGRRKSIRVDLPLYHPLFPGEHQAIVVIQYKVNPLRTETYTIESASFVVE